MLYRWELSVSLVRYSTTKRELIGLFIWFFGLGEWCQVFRFSCFAKNFQKNGEVGVYCIFTTKSWELTIQAQELQEQAESFVVLPPVCRCHRLLGHVLLRESNMTIGCCFDCL